MNYNEEIEKVTNLDPLKEAEQFTGRSYKDDDSTSALGFFLQSEKSKKMDMLMDQTDDTKFRETVSDYINKIVSHGFVKVLEMPFINESDIAEKFYMFFDFDRSILLKFDTYTWKDDGSWAKAGKKVPPPNVNGGDFYYNWSPLKNQQKIGTSSGGFAFDNKKIILLNDDLEIVKDVIIPQSLKYKCVMSEEYSKMFNKREQEIEEIYSKYRFVWEGSHDCREAVFFNISRLEKNGDFLQIWLENSWSRIYPFHYMDWKNEGFDCDATRIERLKMLPKEVKEKINFKM